MLAKAQGNDSSDLEAAEIWIAMQLVKQWVIL